MGLIVIGHGDGHVEPVGITGLGQELLGLFHAVGILIHQLRQEILGKRGIDAAAHGGAVAVGHHVHDALPVDGIAQGLAHQLVVEGLGLVVQIDGLHQVHGALQHLEVLVQLGGLGGGQVGAQVDGPAVQVHHQSVGIFADLIGDLVQPRRGAPVILEPLHDEILLGGPGHEPEGAGAHRSRVLIFIVRGDDGGRHIADELQVPLCDGNGNGLFVQGLHTLDSRKRRYQRLLLTLRHSGAAIDGIYNILCGHCLAVVELHSLTKREGIGGSILGQRVFLRHSGDHFAVGIGLHQSLEDVEQDLSGSCGHRLVGVKTVVQVLGDANGDLATLDRFARFAVISLSAGVLAAVSASREYGADHYQRQEKSQ